MNRDELLQILQEETDGFAEQSRLRDDVLDTLEKVQEQAINYSHCYTMFAGRQQELLEFPEYIAKEHYRLVNQTGKIHYWKNEEEAKTTVQLYNEFKANDL